jgi:hypothetical protein
VDELGIGLFQDFVIEDGRESTEDVGDVGNGFWADESVDEVGES